MAYTVVECECKKHIQENMAAKIFQSYIHNSSKTCFFIMPFIYQIIGAVLTFFQYAK